MFSPPHGKYGILNIFLNTGHNIIIKFQVNDCINKICEV